MGYGYIGYGFDPTIFLVLIGALLSMWASVKLQSTFKKYDNVRSTTGMTGAQAAKRLLSSQGIYDVTIQPVAGELTDHYDSRNKRLNLSESVYQSTTVSAIGVAAHECGHAIQDNVGYTPLKLRGAFVPMANLGSKLSMPLILAGLIFGGMGSTFTIMGIWMFVLVVLFQIITLPVEFNASSRAAVMLDQLGILHGEEVNQTRKVLGAAALTYVAAAAASILQLLRLIILFGGRRNRD